MIVIGIQTADLSLSFGFPCNHLFEQIVSLLVVGTVREEKAR